MAMLDDIDVPVVMDLIRTSELGKATELFLATLKVAHGNGVIEGQLAMAKIADDVFDRAALENTQPKGAA